MSTIEEAREQAREALEVWDTGSEGIVVGASFVACALRILLDATEPSTVAVKTEFRVLDVHGEVWAWSDTLEDARHYAAQEPEGEPARIEQRRVSPWVPVATEPPAPLSIEDFITGTTDGEVDTDEFFADLDERPAEDERETLERAIEAAWSNGSLRLVSEKGPRPITEEELDAMAQRFQEVSRVGIICTGKREIIAGLIAEQREELEMDFDRIIAAHDAEKRAEWEAEQGEVMTGEVHSVSFEDETEREPYCGLEGCELPDHKYPPMPAGTYVTIRLDDSCDGPGSWRVQVKQLPASTTNNETEGKA